MHKTSKCVKWSHEIQTSVLWVKHSTTLRKTPSKQNEGPNVLEQEGQMTPRGSYGDRFDRKPRDINEMNKGSVRESARGLRRLAYISTDRCRAGRKVRTESTLKNPLCPGKDFQKKKWQETKLTDHSNGLDWIPKFCANSGQQQKVDHAGEPSSWMEGK